jgi:hypothetical protein
MVSINVFTYQIGSLECNYILNYSSYIYACVNRLKFIHVTIFIDDDFERI